MGLLILASTYSLRFVWSPRFHVHEFSKWLCGSYFVMGCRWIVCGCSGELMVVVSVVVGCGGGLSDGWVMGFVFRGESYWRAVLSAEIKAAVDSGSELNAYGAFLLVRDGRSRSRSRLSWRERRVRRLFDLVCADPGRVRLLSGRRFRRLMVFLQGLDVRVLRSAVCVPVVAEVVRSVRCSAGFVLWAWETVPVVEVSDAVLACGALSDEVKASLALER